MTPKKSTLPKIVSTKEPQLIPIHKLKLDTANPRFDRSVDQVEASRKLFDSEKIKMTKLAADIAKNGLNPTQLMIVVPEDEWYIVLEGNRRLACIMGLIDPSRVPTEFKSSFERLSNGAAIPKEITCFVVSKRAEANSWIQERHTGSNDGVGVSSWDTEQQRRFLANTIGTPDRTLQLIDWMKENTPEIAKLYQEKNMFTNIERLLDDEASRSALGLKFEKGQLKATVSFDALKKALAKIVKDFHGGATVDIIKNKAKRAAYIKSIEPDLPTGSDSRPEVPLIDLRKEAKSAASGKRTTTKNPLERKTLITKEFKFNCSNNRIMCMIVELRHLDIDRYTNSASMLLRAFLEMSTYLYAKKKGVPKVSGVQGRWDADWNSVINYLESHAYLEKSQITALRKLVSNKDQMLSYDTLHQCVHNKDFFPEKKDLIRIWTMLEPYFVHIGESNV
jgi:hypothetical protein